jgi:hypothetical protein
MASRILHFVIMEAVDQAKPEVFSFRKKKNNNNSTQSFLSESNRSNSVDSFDSHELSNSTFTVTTTEKKAFNFSSLLNVNFRNTYKSMLNQHQEQSEEYVVDYTQDKEEDFILARLEQHSRQQSAKVDKPSSNWFKELQTSFQTAKQNFLGKEEETDEVDWEFWGKVINDYEEIIRHYPKQFQKNLRKGLPEPIRGMMWQLMSNSKSEALEEEYLKLLTRNSRHEKIIQRDLARTFPGHEYFREADGPGQTSLFNILKGFAV